MNTANGNSGVGIPEGQPFPGAKPPPSSVGTETDGIVFSSHQHGSTFIYSDGAVEVFVPGGNIVTDSEKIRQLRAAVKSSGLIREGIAEKEVMVKGDKLAEARAAILASASNQKAAQADPRIAALLEKAKAQAGQAATVQAPNPLGAQTTADVASNAVQSNTVK